MAQWMRLSAFCVLQHSHGSENKMLRMAPEGSLPAATSQWAPGAFWCRSRHVFLWADGQYWRVLCPWSSPAATGDMTFSVPPSRENRLKEDLWSAVPLKRPPAAPQWRCWGCGWWCWKHPASPSPATHLFCWWSRWWGACDPVGGKYHNVQKVKLKENISSCHTESNIKFPFYMHNVCVL